MICFAFISSAIGRSTKLILEKLSAFFFLFYDHGYSMIKAWMIGFTSNLKLSIEALKILAWFFFSWTKYMKIFWIRLPSKWKPKYFSKDCFSHSQMKKDPKNLKVIFLSKILNSIFQLFRDLNFFWVREQGFLRKLLWHQKDQETHFFNLTLELV